MTNQQMDGKSLALELEAGVKEKAILFEKEFNQKPKLAVVLVGDNPASIVYIKKKMESCARAHIESVLKKFPVDFKEEQLIKEISNLNEDKSVHGILVQLPLPQGFDTNKILQLVKPGKDVDGFTSKNFGDINFDNESMLSCTAQATIRLLEKYAVDVKGKHVVIIGNTIVLGRPLSLALMNRDATVTVCNKFTPQLSEITRKADILVSAVGKPGLVTDEMIKDNVVVIDVGISKVDGKLLGDCNQVSPSKCSFITPVPGGVGPMTVACLLQNTVTAAKEQQK